MIDNVEQLHINPNRWYTLPEIHKIILKCGKNLLSGSVRYNIRRYIPYKIEKRNGMGPKVCMVLGEDLEEYITKRYF